jgi:hypothetical protein
MRIKIFLILSLAIFQAISYDLRSQNIDYNVIVTELMAYGDNNDGGGFAGQQDPTWYLWAADNDEGGWSGGVCKHTSNAYGAWWNVDDYTLKSRNDCNATQIHIELEGWEKDGCGSNCEYVTGSFSCWNGDDNYRARARVADINFRDNPVDTWNNYIVNNVDYYAKISIFWNYRTIITPSTPTVSNNNSCSPSLNTVSSNQDNVTWFWQTSSNGTSTAYVSTNPPTVPVGTTTFYLRARGDLNGVWSAASSVIVTRKSESIAATSISGSSTICTGDATTLSVVGGFLGTGANWQWYANSCGGSNVGTGETISVSPAATTTYYVRAEGDCNATSCVSLTVTVGSAPQSITTTTISGLSVSTNPDPYGASLGKAGGLTLTYTNASWPACSNFGVSTSLAAANLNNMAAPDGACTFNNLVYDAYDAETNLENGKVCFTGTDWYYCIDSSGGYSNKSVNVRLRMLVTKIDGTTPKPLSLVNSYITTQANENFVVKAYIEANVSTLDNCQWIGTNYYSLGAWHGVVDVFDALNTDPNRSVCTGFDYNWYNISSNTTSELASTNLICPGSNVGLIGNSSMGNCYTQVWTGPNGFSTTTENPIVTNFQSTNIGTYQLLITDNRSCFGMNTLTINDLYSDGDWVGNAMDGNWHTSANWCGSVPTISDEINITSEAISMPVILNQNVDICGITIEEGSSLTIANDRSLNVYCSFYNYGDFFAGLGSESVTIKGNNCNVLSGGDNFNNFIIDGENASVIMNDNLNIKRDFLIDDGQINTNNFTINLIGSDQQDIKTNSQTLESIVINNSSADNLGVHLLDNLTVSSGITFTNGIVKTGSNKLLILAGASSNEGNQSSFLDGEIEINSSGEFTLPLGDYISRDIGNGNQNHKIWAPLTVSTANQATINASYHYSNEGMPDWWAHGGNMDATMHHVSDREYWVVRSDQNLDDIALYWKNNTHANGDPCVHGFDLGLSFEFDPNDLTIAYWTGSLWSNIGGAVSGDHDNGLISSSYGVPLGAKSETFITFGSKDNVNPLPVDLIDFSCECYSDHIYTSWITASETNSDYFIIEKSIDTKNWFKLAEIAAAGFSNIEKSYSYIDYAINNNNHYYRLKQVDYNGKEETFSIIHINCEGKLKEESSVYVYPNPFEKEINVFLNSIEDQNIYFELYDDLGKMIHRSEYNKTNESSIYTILLDGLIPSVYYLKTITEKEVFNNRIVKESY